MNYSLLAIEKWPRAKLISVRFEPFSRRHYTYKTMANVVPGDFVIVLVGGKFKVVEVVGVNPAEPTKMDIEYRWTVGKVHTDEYKKILETEKQLIAETKAGNR